MPTLAVMSPAPDPRAIRELAYRLWEERGRPGDCADTHWLEAERLLSQVHQDFTRSAEPSLNAGSVSGTDYTPEHPPVNAEFKWAASELNSTRR
jgi:hypothetical protein